MTAVLRTPTEAAYGGVLVSEHAGGVLSDRTGGHVGILVVGGADWEGETPSCRGIAKKTNTPCSAPPVKGQSLCAGHQRAQEKHQKGS